MSAAREAGRVVVIVQNYVPDQQQSMLRFGEMLAVALGRHGLTVKTWRPRRCLGGRLGPISGVSKWLGYVDKFVLGTCALAFLRLRNPGAAWHCVDHSNAGYALVLPRSRLTITCHDCIAIDDALSGRTGEKVGALGPMLQKWIVWGLKAARRVVAVSHATFRDLARIGIDPSKVCVIHNGMVTDYSRIAEAEAVRILEAAGIPTDKPFIFMVGSNLKRKNRIGAVRIFDRLRHKCTVERRLILAGKNWSKDVADAVSAAEFSEDVVEAGTLSNAQLEAAYSLAEIVIFPSLAEGFGLPIIEGQACGALVVASNVEPLLEVGGCGARYADPADAEAFASEMLSALADRELRAAALANAKRFEVPRMAASYASLIGEAR